MLNREEIKNLSGYKYVYKIYISDDVIHHEVFPVIYSNKNYLYYRENKKEQLSQVHIGNGWSWDSRLYLDVNLLYDNLIREHFENWIYPRTYYLLSKNKVNFKDSSIKNKTNEFKELKEKEKQDKLKRHIEELNNKIKELQNQLKEDE